MKNVVWVVERKSVHFDAWDKPVITWVIDPQRGFFKRLDQANAACQTEDERPMALVEA